MARNSRTHRADYNVYQEYRSLPAHIEACELPRDTLERLASHKPAGPTFQYIRIEILTDLAQALAQEGDPDAARIYLNRALGSAVQLGEYLKKKNPDEHRRRFGLLGLRNTIAITTLPFLKNWSRPDSASHSPAVLHHRLRTAVDGQLPTLVDGIPDSNPDDPALDQRIAALAGRLSIVHLLNRGLGGAQTMAVLGTYREAGHLDSPTPERTNVDIKLIRPGLQTILRIATSEEQQHDQPQVNGYDILTLNPQAYVDNSFFSSPDGKPLSERRRRRLRDAQARIFEDIKNVTGLEIRKDTTTGKVKSTAQPASATSSNLTPVPEIKKESGAWQALTKGLSEGISGGEFNAPESLNLLYEVQGEIEDKFTPETFDKHLFLAFWPALLEAARPNTHDKAQGHIIKQRLVELCEKGSRGSFTRGQLDQLVALAVLSSAQVILRPSLETERTASSVNGCGVFHRVGEGTQPPIFLTAGAPTQSPRGHTRIEYHPQERHIEALLYPSAKGARRTIAEVEANLLSQLHK